MRGNKVMCRFLPSIADQATMLKRPTEGPHPQSSDVGAHGCLWHRHEVVRGLDGGGTGRKALTQATRALG